jgi:branched-chain amino acid transport system ATP-binding protein
VSLLDVEGVGVAYGNVVALENAALHVETGEIVTIVGANGAGKSSLMNAIVGLQPLRSGAVRFDGIDLRGWKTHDMTKLGIAYVPEGRGTLRELTVRENLRLGAYRENAGADVARAIAAVVERFPVLGERMSQRAGTLSGGEQQMLVIGRALMCRPRLLLLDEPTLGLAPIVAARILETVAELSAAGIAVLLVEQNARAALKLARRAYVLENGRIVLEGSDLLGDPRVREAYLGELAQPGENAP